MFGPLTIFAGATPARAHGSTFDTPIKAAITLLAEHGYVSSPIFDTFARNACFENSPFPEKTAIVVCAPFESCALSVDDDSTHLVALVSPTNSVADCHVVGILAGNRDIADCDCRAVAPLAVPIEHFLRDIGNEKPNDYFKGLKRGAIERAPTPLTLTA